MDSCRAIDAVLRDGAVGEVYNIGSGIKLQNIEVTRKILNAVDALDDLIEFVEDRAGHDQRYALDTRKIDALGWEPRISFEEGLERTAEYYRQRFADDQTVADYLQLRSPTCSWRSKRSSKVQLRRKHAIAL